jgi:hypothetical protein
MKWMVWEMARIGLAVSLVVGTADFLFAQQTKEPGTPPQATPIIPGLGMMGPGLPAQSFNPFSAMGKSDVQAPPGRRVSTIPDHGSSYLHWQHPCRSCDDW